MGRNRVLVLLLLVQISLFGVDYDAILIGSSPFSLFEAIYQSRTGKKVLIIEQSAECGGAWKGINICGFEHVDLGCHQIGQDMQLKTFLEDYVGCKIVSLDNPFSPYDSTNGPNGWYFSRGCYELIENLLKILETTDVSILTETKAENIAIDKSQNMATVQTKGRSYTTNKVIVTPMSCISLTPCSQTQNYSKSKYYHLYLLIQDPTPPKFSYRPGTISGVSRLMNLTHFVGLTGTGRHLIVIQTHNEQSLSNGEAFLEGLKKTNLIDPSAYILKSEPYIYESGSFHQGLIGQTGAQGIIEVLQTGHIQNLANYISKWKPVLKSVSKN